MLKIKLARIGKKGQPQYRIVVREDRTKQGGNYVADLGYYNPLTDPSTFNIDQAAYQEWLKKGAQPTMTIRRLATPSTTASQRSSKSEVGKVSKSSKTAK